MSPRPLSRSPHTSPRHPGERRDPDPMASSRQVDCAVLDLAAARLTSNQKPLPRQQVSNCQRGAVSAGRRRRDDLVRRLAQFVHRLAAHGHSMVLPRIAADHAMKLTRINFHVRRATALRPVDLSAQLTSEVVHCHGLPSPCGRLVRGLPPLSLTGRLAGVRFWCRLWTDAAAWRHDPIPTPCLDRHGGNRLVPRWKLEHWCVSPEYVSFPAIPCAHPWTGDLCRWPAALS